MRQPRSACSSACRYLAKSSSGSTVSVARMESRVNRKTPPSRCNVPSTLHPSSCQSSRAVRATARKLRMKQLATAAHSNPSGDHCLPSPPNCGGGSAGSAGNPSLFNSTEPLAAPSATAVYTCGNRCIVVPAPPNGLDQSVIESAARATALSRSATRTHASAQQGRSEIRFRDELRRHCAVQNDDVSSRAGDAGRLG